jgi:hypothetical protein
MGFESVFALPASGWTVVGKAERPKGYRYVDRGRRLGPIQSVVIKNGKLLRIAGAGAALGIRLDVAPDPTLVEIGIGDARYCMAFGGTTTYRAGRRYAANAAPAPEGCR